MKNGKGLLISSVIFLIGAVVFGIISCATYFGGDTFDLVLTCLFYDFLSLFCLVLGIGLMTFFFQSKK